MPTDAEFLHEYVRRKQIRDELARIKKEKSWCPHEPTPKQREFLDAPSFECLYGGAAGGGKTDALLMAALQYVNEPGFAALILRKTYADLSLPGAIMDRAHDWLQGTDAKWIEKSKQWIFPSGAIIQFGYLENEKDKYRYQSSEFQLLVIDELSQFTETSYRYLLSRLRRKETASVPIRVRAASNPGGIGHHWVHSRFVLREVEGCEFIPAKLDDNPHLDRKSYREALDKLDSVTRAQLLDGQWILDTTGLVYRFDSLRNLVDSFPRLFDPLFVLGIDLGASQHRPTTAFSVWAYSLTDPEQVVCVETYAESGLIPTTIAERINYFRSKYGVHRIVADAGALGMGYVEEFRRRHILPVEPARKTDKLGFRKLMNGDFERGAIKVIRQGNEDLVAEWQALSWDESGTDTQKGMEDHLSDAALYAWREARYWQAQKPDLIPRRGTAERAIWEEDRMKAEFIRKLNRKRGAHDVYLLSD